MAESENLLPWDFSEVDIDQPAMNRAKILRLENAEKRSQALDSLIEVLQEDESFRPYLDINFLMRFVRGAKFRVDAAKKRLTRYYEIQRLHPNIFGNFLPSSTLRAQSLNHIFALPSRIEDNSIVLVQKIGKFDPTIVSFDDFLRLTLLVHESLLQNPVTQLCGITEVFDMAHVSQLQLNEWQPSRIETLFDVFHASTTHRIIKTHIVNSFGLSRALFTTLLPTLSTKMKKRVFVHEKDDWESFHSDVPPEILPEEYSGYLPASRMVNVYDLINFNEDHFKERMQCGFKE